jgi:hypothetical protein
MLVRRLPGPAGMSHRVKLAGELRPAFHRNNSLPDETFLLTPSGTRS